MIYLFMKKVIYVDKELKKWIKENNTQKTENEFLKQIIKEWQQTKPQNDVESTLNFIFNYYELPRNKTTTEDIMQIFRLAHNKKPAKAQPIVSAKQEQKPKKDEPEPLEVKYYLELPVPKSKYLTWLKTLTFDEIKKTLTLPPTSEVPNAKDLRIINDEENIIARDKYIQDWPTEEKMLLLNIYNKINDTAEDSLHLITATNEEKELLLKLPSECLTFKLDYWKDINKK